MVWFAYEINIFVAEIVFYSNHFSFVTVMKRLCEFSAPFNLKSGKIFSFINFLRFLKNEIKMYVAFF